MKKGVAWRIMTFRKGRSATVEVLGISVEEISSNINTGAEDTELTGVIIRKVVPGKPAHHAGLNCGDIIIRVGEDSVYSANQFYDFIQEELRKGEIKLLIRDKERRRSITLVFLTVR